MLTKLCEKIPCRKQQICSVLDIIKQDDDVVPPAVFIYGHTATGKTLVMRNVLEALSYNHVIVNCVECYTPQLLFEPILNKIHGHEPTYKNNYTPYMSCDNMMDFVNCIKDSEVVTLGAPCIIRLRDLDATLLSAFLRLQELAGLPNICVFLLSDVVWEKFHIKENFMEPIQIHFPQYTKDELVEIFMLDHCGSEWPESFYCNYIKLFLGIFYRACRDLNELKHMARLNFSKYCEPVLKGEADETKEETLKSGLSTSAKYALSFELPYYTKFFLIAAYLASYNPAKADCRLYVKNHGKKKKTKRQHQQQKQSEQLLGPKPFAVDRLLAIFYAIVKEDVNLTAILLSQMSSLVKLQLLTVVGDDRIDMPRYKNVNFNIRNYLYEYL
ncbi:Origin recognition complex subunit 5 [Blattella germanica]|nr:Origin recognition complex subunit 5 [Blattella germanica]